MGHIDAGVAVAAAVVGVHLACLPVSAVVVGAPDHTPGLLAAQYAAGSAGAAQCVPVQQVVSITDQWCICKQLFSYLLTS